MELKALINSPGLWIASSVMMIVLIGGCLAYLKLSIKEAKRLEMPKEKIVAGVRSACITTIGPALACVVVLVSFLSIFGAPTAWMRLNDVGAARSELSVTAIASQIVGQVPGEAGFDVTGFTYSLWGMALNNLGWLVVTLVFTSRMGKIVTKLNSKYNPKLVNMVMQGSVFGIFAYMVANNTYSKGSLNIIAAVVSGISMFVIGKFFKNPRLQELSLGIAMIIGMVAATICQYQGIGAV